MPRSMATRTVRGRRGRRQGRRPRPSRPNAWLTEPPGQICARAFRDADQIGRRRVGQPARAAGIGHLQTGVAGVPSTSSPGRRSRAPRRRQSDADGGALDLATSALRHGLRFVLRGTGGRGPRGGVIDLLTGGDPVLEHALRAGLGGVGVASLRAHFRERRRRLVCLIDQDAVVDAGDRLTGDDVVAFAREQLHDPAGDLRGDSVRRDREAARSSRAAQSRR